MNWIETPSRSRYCDCRADVTKVTTMRRVLRGMPPVPKKAQMVWHRRGETRWWHWSDQDVSLTAP